MEKNEYYIVKSKRTWSKPELIDLGGDAKDIKFAFAAGTDGDTGVNTSMS